MKFYFNDLLDAGLPIESIGDEPGLREDDQGYYVADIEAFKWWVTLTWALDYLEGIGHEIEEVHEYQDYIDIAKELKEKGL